MKAASAPGLDGILLVDKAMGWTSHDAVAKTRRITGQRRIGHTGTLDPMATGLLVLCLGNATRLVEYMALHDKRYTGTIRLGSTTDTDDAEGAVLERRPVPVLTTTRLTALAAQFTGTIEQRPPAYSAIKVGGKRAYAVARAGGTVGLASRSVRIDRLELRQVGPDSLAVEVDCGPGTYIRSLARDIGVEVGCGAHLSALRRASVAAFKVEEAWSLDELERLVAANLLAEALLPADEGVITWDAALLAEEPFDRFRHGEGVACLVVEERTEGPLRVYGRSGVFAGAGILDEDGRLRPVKVLA
jgi:tRNA pseudouridine55 synthase